MEVIRTRLPTVINIVKPKKLDANCQQLPHV